MENLRFRAWDKEDNKMVRWENLRLVKNNRDKDLRVVDITYSPIKFKKAKLMQSTGLKDINGIEIYEGDIVHVNYKLSIVKYAKGSFYIEFIDFPKIIMLSDFYFKSYTNDLILKVQGNIYENPELLEDE
ncbi:YopX family protein [Staphylococcus pettenkoferi]|uniref:YopX family protein n=1 Tax=Staphylococcus pettenkoferi TaxID=170573 RepID=UPI001F567742|nr:YopX family protein [Staphylococcus pettenkoferi]MCI2791049.1 YopX family protein [Staphylococcus pettenkoferi]